MTDSSENNNEIIIKKPQSCYYKILKLVEQIADETGGLPFSSEDIGLSAENMKNYIEFLNRGDNSIYIVAYDKDSPIGFAYLEGGRRLRTHHIANLGIGVLKAYQGKGTGQRLLQELVAYARESESIAKIDLQVRKDNTQAIKIYKAVGFEVEGINKRALFIKGEFYDYLNMGMTID